MYKNILFPVDLEHTREAHKALEVAIAEAQRSGAKLTVMTVATGFGMPIVASFFDETTVAKALKEVAKRLKKYVSDNVPKDINSKATVVEGNPAELIIKQAKKDKTDLIVLSSHNSKLDEFLLGSCAAKVVRHSKSSVMVVK